MKKIFRPVDPTEAWALVNAKQRLIGGDYRPFIYWTHRQAKLALQAYPECVIVPVEIVFRTPKRAD